MLSLKLKLKRLKKGFKRRSRGSSSRTPQIDPSATSQAGSLNNSLNEEDPPSYSAALTDIQNEINREGNHNAYRYARSAPPTRDIGATADGEGLPPYYSPSNDVLLKDLRKFPDWAIIMFFVCYYSIIWESIFGLYWYLFSGNKSLLAFACYDILVTFDFMDQFMEWLGSKYSATGARMSRITRRIRRSRMQTGALNDRMAFLCMNAIEKYASEPLIDPQGLAKRIASFLNKKAVIFFFCIFMDHFNIIPR